MLIDSVNSNLPHPENVFITTRRAISSNMGKIFDPIGLLTPVTFQCKILFQMTWEHEIGWDDDVGATITDQFKAWMIGLHHLSEPRIPRFVANFAIEKIQLYMPDHWEHLKPSLPCYVPSPDWRPEKHLACRDLNYAQWF